MLKRIKNLILAFRFFFSRSAKKTPENPQTIVVAYLGKIGDMVCVTPLFRAIKEKYPSCRLIVLGNKINREILAGNRDVDHYLIFKDIKKSANDLKALKADFGILISPSFDLLVCLFMALLPAIVVPRIVGDFSPYETIPYKILRRKCLVVEHKFGQYALGEYFNLLKPLGISKPEGPRNLKKHLAFTKMAEETMTALLLKEKNNSEILVGILVSAGNKIKEWPKENFISLIEKINQNYKARIFFIGSESDKTLARDISEKVSGSSVNLAGSLSIDTLKALISKLDVVIGVDTGPIYIAEAFDIPTIDILGPMAENEQPPIGERHLIVKTEREKPQLHIMNARVYDFKEARRQIEAISPDWVFLAFTKLFQEKNK